MGIAVGLLLIHKYKNQTSFSILARRETKHKNNFVKMMIHNPILLIQKPM